VGEVTETGGTKVFQVVDSEAIRANGTRVAAFPDGPLDSIWVKTVEGVVEWVVFDYLAFEYAGCWIGGVWNCCGELSIESGGYLFV